MTSNFTIMCIFKTNFQWAISAKKIDPVRFFMIPLYFTTFSIRAANL